MSDEIVFHHNPQSRSRMVHWMLEEVGAPYRVQLVRWEPQDAKTPEFLAINPMGKIPVIQHRGRTVTETAAIIAYLADAFPHAGLAPDPTSPERGPYYRWLFFGAGCVEPALLDAMSRRSAPENSRAAGYGSYDTVVDTLLQVLGAREWVAGDRFSAADLYLASELGFMGLFGAPRIKGDAVFEAYLARCTDREGYRRANAEPVAA